EPKMPPTPTSFSICVRRRRPLPPITDVWRDIRHVALDDGPVTRGVGVDSDVEGALAGAGGGVGDEAVESLRFGVAALMGEGFGPGSFAVRFGLGVGALARRHRHGGGVYSLSKGVDQAGDARVMNHAQRAGHTLAANRSGHGAGASRLGC